MHLTYVTGRVDGTSRRIGDDMHLHSRPAERTHGSQRSVVKGIPVDPQQNSGDAGVKKRHEFSSFFRIGSPARASAATRKPQRQWRHWLFCA
ncbi:hypothetical protein SNL152K_6601 [Streptomyces sp. NL15-2K]|nr:hypothetical protein SNL152K_6601 [Streptomyces sp. NL15-2K]